MGLNAIAVKLGDEFLEGKQFAEALTSYRVVRAREEVLKGASLVPFVGKRARKGKAQDAVPKALRLSS